MPAGRKANLDVKIARLIGEWRRALIARETVKIESAIAPHVDALVRGLATRG